MEQLVSLAPLLLILVVFYLLILRPARKRASAALAMQQRVEPGVPVMTSAGMYGRVVSVAGDRMVLETAPGVHSTWALAAVASIVGDEGPDGAVDLGKTAGP